MKQLAFNYEFKGEENTPSFDTWYSENTKERNQWGEKPHKREKAKEIYESLVRNDFFSEGSHGF